MLSVGEGVLVEFLSVVDGSRSAWWMMAGKMLGLRFALYAVFVATLYTRFFSVHGFILRSS
jgi:hypothetical protein